jgi:RHS repeat-associated protein
VGTVSETDFGYTGQRALGDLGLMDYHARMYDATLGRFIQPDSIIPGIANPQSLNRYAYVMGNPLRYNDPTGYYGKTSGCDTDYLGTCKQLLSSIVYNTIEPIYSKESSDVKRQDKIYSRMFRGSGKNNDWISTDWLYYYQNRNDLWKNPGLWINPDSEKGWNLFVLHVRRLASYYTIDQKDEFVRDFALAFGGIPYYKSTDEAAMDAAHGPAVYNGSFRSYINEGLEGLDTGYLDVKSTENQSHHYAGIFFLAYFFGSNEAMALNYGRDSKNPGDVNLGNAASVDAFLFSFSSNLGSVADMISWLGKR